MGEKEVTADDGCVGVACCLTLPCPPSRSDPWPIPKTTTARVSRETTNHIPSPVPSSTTDMDRGSFFRGGDSDMRNNSLKC
eukprot:scaffold342_cov128-Amphora_coffeaeformis.AAC.4